MSWDNGLGKGLGCSQVQDSQSGQGYCGWHEVSIVLGGTEFQLSCGIPSQSGITES